MAKQNQEQLKQNLKNTNQWIRIIYMVLFSIILYFAMTIVGILIFIQALSALIMGSDNKNLRKFGADLTQYIYQIILFLTYNENQKPFPFAPWGKLEEIEDKAVEVDEHNDDSTENESDGGKSSS